MPCIDLTSEDPRERDLPEWARERLALYRYVLKVVGSLSHAKGSDSGLVVDIPKADPVPPGDSVKASQSPEPGDIIRERSQPVMYELREFLEERGDIDAR